MCASRNEGCNTPEIEAEPFTLLVVRRAVHAFLSPGNTYRVLEVILNEAEKEDRGDLRAVLELEQEEQPSRDEEQTTRAVLFALSGPIPPELADVSAGRFVPQTAFRKVEEYGLNPETYLRPSNLRTTKAIMDILISEILVGHRSATIRYSLPVNPGGWPEFGTDEEVPVG